MVPEGRQPVRRDEAFLQLTGRRARRANQQEAEADGEGADRHGREEGRGARQGRVLPLLAQRQVPQVRREPQEAQRGHR